jgi:hypothetical protein
MLAMHIGGKEAEYVRVEILRDNGDGWLSAEVDVSVGAFRARYHADFVSLSFERFHGQLAEMYRTVSGAAEFTCYERQLEMAFTCNATGHIQVRGQAMDVAGTGNTLNFRLDLDQTHVPKILSGLRLLSQQYSPRAV